jgi:hypothetical protein
VRSIGNVRLWNLLAIVTTLISIACGCGGGVSKGKPFAIPNGKDIVVFGAEGVDKAFEKNRWGETVPGMEIEGASLIRDQRDLQERKHRIYIVFYDFLMGNMVRGSYWSQLSEKRIRMGLPSMDTHLTKVLIVQADDRKIVQTTEIRRIAHVRISVDTNDFGRPFVP